MTKEEILKEVGESPKYRLFEFFLQEHGITLLEGQMHDIIHEVQIYLDATNDKAVVKENLTSEERAIAEAKTIISEYANNSHISREYYAEGYLSGYHYRDEEVKAYREALKEIVQECEYWTIPNAEQANNGSYDYYVEVEDLKAMIAKAKQLLKEEA